MRRGRLTHSNTPDPPPPYNNIGFQILKPRVLGDRTGAFSIVPIWKQLSAEGRLFGAVTDARIIHVSSPPDVGGRTRRWRRENDRNLPPFGLSLWGENEIPLPLAGRGYGWGCSAVGGNWPMRTSQRNHQVRR